MAITTFIVLWVAELGGIHFWVAELGGKYSTNAAHGYYNSYSALGGQNWAA